MMTRTHTNANLMTMSARLMLALVVAGAFSPLPCFGQDLPGSKEIIARMIEAEGGAAAKRKIKNRVIKLTLDFGVGGMTAKGLVHQARTSRMHTDLEIQGMGTIQEGVTDGVAWSLAAMTGPQIKEGGERAMALWEANMDGLLDWKRHFKKIECVGKETQDDKECFKLEWTPIDGSVITMYVDAKTYLPHRSELTLSTAMGEFDMIIHSEDYRPVDGVKYPHRSRIEVMGQNRVVTIESIKHNVDMPKDRFKLPDEIKALVAKAKEEKSKESKGEKDKKGSGDKGKDSKGKKGKP